MYSTKNLIFCLRFCTLSFYYFLLRLCYLHLWVFEAETGKKIYLKIYLNENIFLLWDPAHHITHGQEKLGWFVLLYCDATF